MRLMNTDDFLLGYSQPIRPSSPFMNELILRGISQKEINDFLQKGICEETGSPFVPYSNAHGYLYEWGHIIENNYYSYANEKLSHFASWSFCLDELLSHCHTKGICSHDLTDLLVDVLRNPKKRPNISLEIPNYIQVVPDRTISAFCFVVGGAGANGLEEIHIAREWIACCFLDHILYRVIHVTKKSLRKSRNEVTYG